MTDRARLSILAAVLVLCALYAGASQAEEYVARFHQPEPPVVASHEYQILESEWLDIDTSGSIAEPCVGCWQQTITVPQPGYLRVRAIGLDGQPSLWSRCPVPVPEPVVGLGLAIGALWALGLAGRPPQR